METEAPPPSGPPAAAAYPGWVLLDRCGDDYPRITGDDDDYPRITGDDDDYSRLTSDDTTSASCFTSTGYPIRVSFRLAAPPASSCLYVRSKASHFMHDPRVLTAHGDALLIQIVIRIDFSCRLSEYTVNHFVYSARASRRLPSLRLLPHSYFVVRNIRRSFCDKETPKRGFFIEDQSDLTNTPRMLDRDATGFLRRGGKDGFVVAELQMVPSEHCNPAAELLLLDSSSGKWIIKRVPISHGVDKCRELSLWRTDAVVPVGDRLLCWVDLSNGVMFSDVLGDTPNLRYVSFPVTVERWYGCPIKMSRNVCATAGGTVKLVDISGFHPYGSTVNTWTLRMDDMVWVKDGTVDTDALWTQDAWKGVPRAELKYPVVSIDDPDVICFLVCEKWLVMVDMRSRTVQSVSHCPVVRLRGPYFCEREPETSIPSKFSSYFNYYPRGSSASMHQENSSGSRI